MSVSATCYAGYFVCRQSSGGGAALPAGDRGAGAGHRRGLLGARRGPASRAAAPGQDADQPGRGRRPTALPRSVNGNGGQ